MLCAMWLAARAPLPTHVDLRKTYVDYGLTVCDQRGPLCWDYTVVGLMEYEFATQRHESNRLSPGFLAWAAGATDSESNAGSNFGRAYRGLEKFGLAPLSLGGDPELDGRGPTPDVGTLKVAAGIGRIDVHWIRFWNNHDELTGDQLRSIEEELADGHPVAVGMRWPNKTSFLSSPPYTMEVPERDQIFDGHCVALVGYQLDPNLPGGGAFLFRNSWGEKWADHGYAWMPFGLLNFCVNDALSVRLWKPLLPEGPTAHHFEAEDLVVQEINGTPPHVQDMTAFGPYWGGGKQLLFNSTEAGQSFALDLPVASSGRYELRLFITRAQDFGKFRVSVAGRTEPEVPLIIDGAGPGASRSNAIPCGRYDLKQGTNQIVFTVTGKGSASTGMFVGIDSLALVPVG